MSIKTNFKKLILYYSKLCKQFIYLSKKIQYKLVQNLIYLIFLGWIYIHLIEFFQLTWDSCSSRSLVVNEQMRILLPNTANACIREGLSSEQAGAMLCNGLLLDLNMIDSRNVSFAIGKNKMYREVQNVYKEMDEAPLVDGYLQSLFFDRRRNFTIVQER